MRKTRMQLIAMGVAAAVTVGGTGMNASASSSKVTNVLPSAGISYALTGDSVSLSNLADENSDEAAEPDIQESAVTITETTPLASTLQENILNDIQKATGATIPAEEPGTGTEDNSEEEMTAEEKEEERFKSLVIANVNDYVNVRDNPSEEDGEIIGKLYDDSVGTFIEEADGWYKIKSGRVEGYVKAEYCVTGEDAVELAKEVGKRIATVTTTTLKVRSGPSTDDEVLGLVPIEDELVVTEELDGWVKVSIEEGEGYVSMDYVELSTEFVEAESKEEEEARLKKEEEARKAALAQAKKNTKSSSSNDGGSSKSYNSAASYTTQSSSIGSAVASYAQQFVGNPYVYGGTSLTNGADCSGFVMSVYANFGVSLPHSSGADRSVGAAVDGLANAQPGDIVCYSGHVGIYIGGGQIVHASSAKTGIKISNASYRQVLSVRRIF
ncbi:NlpC/P60 family protein [Butyrivibrio sp. INlla16]|uniref:C40 family peptidase n=1 Tax=Butyrivibrio sp. INlla16 TaxID=1520807 RepID=UPI00088BCDC0|nr:NlpC/P60 family protein [Butyrivibrio sp. INlla16]SDB45364.1 Cell wall-associated hydrolase, NlpC family [Butyrivibrio sp. INlla16]